MNPTDPSEELKKKINKIILAIDVYDDTSVDEDEAKRATYLIMALIASYAAKEVEKDRKRWYKYFPSFKDVIAMKKDELFELIATMDTDMAWEITRKDREAGLDEAPIKTLQQSKDSKVSEVGDASN